MRSWTLRRMTTADLAEADVLLRATFDSPSSALPRLHRYLAIEPHGWILAEQEGQLLGMVGAVCHGHEAFAYIGFMAVAAAAQQRGIGRALLERLLGWLDGRGVRCAVLDATPEGARLYERSGFVETGTSCEWASTEGTLAWAQQGAAPTPGALRITASDEHAFQEIVTLDQRLFGAERGRLWRRLLDERQHDVLVARAPSDGALAGVLCRQASGIAGPWVTGSATVARELLRHAILLPPATEAQAQTLRVQIPGENQRGLALLTEAGFTLKRSPPHMRHGALATVPPWLHVYGKESFCVG